MTDNPQLMETAVGEAIGLFRIVRRLPLESDNDFEIVKKRQTG